MSVKRLLLGVATVAVVAVVVVGVRSSRETERSTPPVLTAQRVRDLLVGSPPRLAALHAKADTLLHATPEGIRREIGRLRGTPVVVNMWGSWCGPCRLEMPLLQRANVRYGKRVAFVGIDVKDGDASAARFLRAVPVGYPSYVDGDGVATQRIAAPAGLPTTVFYTADGRQQIHQGPYTSQTDLDRDIRRYALGG